MKTNQPIILVAILLFSITFFAPIAHAEACKVYDTQTNTVLPDTDCDVYPDNDDNCPSSANEDQKDSNGNGIGDACERQMPPVYTTNRGPIARVQTADAVGIQMVGRVSTAGSVPSAATAGPGSLLAVTYTSSHTLDAGGSGEFYEIHIKNNGNEVSLITIQAQGVVGWGTYSLKPSNSIVLQPGEETSAYVFVRADYAAEPGQKPFTIRLKNDGSETILNMEALVQGSLGSRGNVWDRMNAEIGLILIIVLVLIIGIIVGTMNYLRKSKEKVE
jgi:hypothetical protein